MKCIVCKTEHENKIFDLGNLYPSKFVTNTTRKDVKVPLCLCQCPNCSFVQLNHILEQDDMYREYWYRSSTNSSMVDSLKDIYHAIVEKKSGEIKRVLDIGANVGTLLSFFKQNFYKVFTVGVDPANNLAEEAIKYCDVFINNYFDDSIYFPEKFDVITSIAMFYDVPEPDKFIKKVKSLLAHDGIWVIQMTDLLCTIDCNAFDNLVHEHIGYYTIELLSKMLEQHDLEIFDVTYNDVNGASVRLYIGHKDVYKVKKTYTISLVNEHNILNEFSWDKFKLDILETKDIIKDFLKGKNVYGLGASTKGNTLLQVFELTNSDIHYIFEVSKEKFGKYCLGSGILIIDEKIGFAMNPEYLFVLPWHFIDNFCEKYRPYLEGGGKFIVPLPEPRVIGMKDGELYEHPICK